MPSNSKSSSSHSHLSANMSKNGSRESLTNMDLKLELFDNIGSHLQPNTGNYRPPEERKSIMLKSMTYKDSLESEPSVIQSKDIKKVRFSDEQLHS